MSMTATRRPAAAQASARCAASVVLPAPPFCCAIVMILADMAPPDRRRTISQISQFGRDYSLAERCLRGSARVGRCRRMTWAADKLGRLRSWPEGALSREAYAALTALLGAGLALPILIFRIPAL